MGKKNRHFAECLSNVYLEVNKPDKSTATLSLDKVYILNNQLIKSPCEYKRLLR